MYGKNSCCPENRNPLPRLKVGKTWEDDMTRKSANIERQRVDKLIKSHIVRRFCQIWSVFSLTFIIFAKHHPSWRKVVR